MKSVRSALLALLLLAAGFLAPLRTLAYQSFMSKAKKFGAKDCLFCHVHEDGGQGWNERGQWLIDQKAERKAEKIDVEWLVDYNRNEAEGEKGKADEKKQKPEKNKRPS